MRRQRRKSITGRCRLYSKLSKETNDTENPFGSKILIIGLSSIVFVPIFKIITDLPPYVGMMLSLAVVSIIAESFNAKLAEDQNSLNLLFRF